MKTVAGISGMPRRQHERAFKDELVEQCLVPGASVAAIALAGGINANLLFKWRRDHLRSKRLSGAALIIDRACPRAGYDGHGYRRRPLAAIGAVAGIGSDGGVPTRCTRAGAIELDIAGAQLRLRGAVDEASLCSVLRALRQAR